ncbi:hypothetical protein [Herbiconiux flava]|uniref:Uncharacterized protein n=1 Tax=Herbiconiux flava TaxID=881268 RepID=A0A852SP20_9MICO|nr:hypothetical protein [Herbiconiux flava]NYD70569.1 hypothetical protein [Herbiconiux flava]
MATKVLACSAPLADKVADTLPLDVKLHLRKRSHHREHHCPYRRSGVNITAAAIHLKASPGMCAV